MIVANIVPNEDLKKTLATKMSTVLFRIDEIPVYDPLTDINRFQRYVVDGKSDKVTIEILKCMDRHISPHKKDVLHYVKSHIADPEALEISLTLHYYDRHAERYAEIQKLIPDSGNSPMRINKDFFKIIRGKNGGKRRFFELAVIELMTLAYKIHKSDRLDLVSREEWEREVEHGAES